MSLPEVLLWQHLRMKPGGRKFRRQHLAGPYVLDFYCSDARLAIEIDGEVHNRGDRPARDEARDAWLAANGVDVTRIPAAEIFRDVNAVVEGITAHVTERCLPLHQPSAGPPPRAELGAD